MIESEDTEKRGISQRRPSFLTGSFEEVKENTQLKTQTFLDQKPLRQRLENPPPVEKDNYTENRKGRVRQYPEEERKSHFPPPVESPIYAKDLNILNNRMQKVMDRGYHCMIVSKRITQISHYLVSKGKELRII